MLLNAELGDRGFNSGAVAASILVDLVGGKRLYDIPGFVAGTALEIPTNTLLTVGNFYAITIHYVDTDVSVYGPDETFDDYYVNGYAFTAANTAAVIAQVGGAASQNDLMFVIYSTQDAYVSLVLKSLDAAPGANALDYIYIEDANMSITDIVSGATRPPQIRELDFTIPVFLEKGSKFEVYYNDDPSDSVSLMDLLIRYAYIPQAING